MLTSLKITMVRKRERTEQDGTVALVPIHPAGEPCWHLVLEEGTENNVWLHMGEMEQPRRTSAGRLLPPPPHGHLCQGSRLPYKLCQRGTGGQKASFVKSRSQRLCTRISSFLPFSYVLSAII